MARYKSQYHTRKLPKQSKTIPLYGDKDRGNGLDFGRFFRCWNCGWTVDIWESSHSGTPPGTGYTDGSSLEDSFINNQSILGGLDEIFVSLELSADGTPKTIAHYLESVISGGCPLCGTKNWLG